MTLSITNLTMLAAGVPSSADLPCMFHNVAEVGQSVVGAGYHAVVVRVGTAGVVVPSAVLERWWLHTQC